VEGGGSAQGSAAGSGATPAALPLPLLLLPPPPPQPPPPPPLPSCTVKPARLCAKKESYWARTLAMLGLKRSARDVRLRWCCSCAAPRLARALVAVSWGMPGRAAGGAGEAAAAALAALAVPAAAAEGVLAIAPREERLGRGRSEDRVLLGGGRREERARRACTTVLSRSTPESNGRGRLESCHMKEKEVGEP
jgi:hypothetical protein